MVRHFINIKQMFGVHSAGIKRLEGKDMNHFSILTDVYMSTKDGLITDIGSMKDWTSSSDEIVDLNNTSIFPCYCDSHTHIVFAEPREREFEMKIKGMTYEQIAEAGGGILNSANKLQSLSEDELFVSASERLRNVIKMGTGAIEIKSGYGLTIEAELKMLRVIKRLKEHFNLPIKATFLGAHAIPASYKSNPDQYVEEVVLVAMKQVHEEQLAEYVDIFIEKNYFTIKQSETILEKAKEYGLKPKLHVNQLSNSGGVQFGVSQNALSLDHLEEIDQAEIDSLKNQKTIATLLPSCSFFIKIPFAPARKMIDEGLSVALASDYNPGSTPSGNMNFVVSLACIYQKMTPNEALNAATLNGAYAMELETEVGSLTVGKRANFFTSNSAITSASIPYSFGMPIIDEVYLAAKKFN